MRIAVLTMPSAEERIAWWERGVSDGIDAAMHSACVALGIIGETLDAGDVEHARMLVSVYGGLLSADRFPRHEDGRISSIELFLNPEHIEMIRRHACAPADSEPETDRGGGSAGTT